MNWSEHRFAFLLAAALVCIVALFDFSNRLYVGRDRSLRAFVAPPVRVAAAVPSREAVLQDLTKWVGQDRAAQPKPRQIVLQGVFYAGATPRAAVSLVAEDGRPTERMRVSIGDVVEGWKVESIDPKRVLLKRDSESRELVLFKRR